MLWLREVNKSIKEYLQTLYTNVKNVDGTLIDIPVIIRTPQTDALEETLPCISIYTYDMNDNLRMTDLNSKEYKTEGKVVTVKDKPLKRNIGVQIDFYTHTLGLMDELTYKWITSNRPHSMIDITDSEGNIYACPFKRKGSPVRVDMPDYGDILYRVSYSHTVIIPITYEPQQMVMIEKVLPNIK